MNREELIRLLDRKKIEYELTEHEAVFTMDEMRQLRLPFEKDVPVSLFLRDDKKHGYYLICTDGEQKTDLKALRHIIGSRPLSFASEKDLAHYLHLKKGSVTPFGVLNEEEHIVQTYLDIRFQNRMIAVHPLENTATVHMRTDDLFALLNEEGHPVQWVDLRQIL